jgi:PAS domain S-box-containing protein
MLVYLDPEFNFVWVNDSYARTCQMRPEEMTGRNHFELYPDAENEAIFRGVRDTGVAAFYKDKPFEFPDQPERGVTYWDWSLAPVKDAAGAVEGLVFSLRETTAYKRAELGLARRQQQLYAFIEHAPVSMAMFDRGMNYLVCSQRWLADYGRGRPSLSGRNHYEVHPDLPEEWEEVHRRGMAGETIKNDEDHWRQADGSDHWLRWAVVPWLDERGDVGGIIISAEDITERKRAERELVEARDAAEKANQAKSRFLSAANHDLRQPLYAIKLLVNALSLQEVGQAADQMVQDINNAVHSMEGMLSTLLDISKLDAGIILPKQRDFHLAPLMCQLQRQFRLTAKERGKHVRLVHCDPVLHTDPILLERILQNFLSNAIYHTEGQRILMGCRRAGTLRRIEVWDTGTGIPADQLDRIFEDFYQVENAARTSSRGLGLGLAITRRIADLLGLRLLVRSVVGKGTVFAIEVPTGQEADRASKDDSVTSGLSTGRRRCVLVVDDDQAVLSATSRLLKLYGHDVIGASGAEEALDLVRRHGPDIDVLLVDYRLPGGWDGLRLIQSIRAAADWELPAILVTGDTSLDDLRTLHLSGISLFYKPLDPAALRQQLEEAPRKEDLAP